MADTDALDTKILKQVDYYFGDSNYPKDKFLRNKAKENPGGYIPLSVLTTFNRLKSLTTDPASIAKAIKSSTIVELNEDSTMLKRKAPLPEDDTSLLRTIYSKGWPVGATIEQVSSLFSAYGTVLSVRLRKRNTTHEFKGTVLIEFSSEDEAKAALAAAPQIEGHTLLYQTKEAWAQEKREAFQNKKAKKAEKKEKQEKDGKKRKEPEDPESNNEAEEYTKGLILSVKGVGESLKREDLKPVFAEFGDVLFLDFVANATDAYVRYASPEDASKALEALTASKREFGAKVPSLSILEGDEEKKYWELVAKAKADKRQSGRGRGGRGRGRGGRGRGGGKSKKQKTQ